MKKFLFLVLVLVLSGCSTIKNSALKIQKDTCYITKTHVDSIYITDSIWVEKQQKNDTIWIEKVRWRTQYKGQIQKDTVYIAKNDTIKEEKTIQLPPERYIPKWILVLALIGGGLILFFVGKYALKIYTKIQTGGLL